MRVWDRGDDDPASPSIPFTPATPVAPSASGVRITIDGEVRRSGDYWIIAARPETPDRVVPWELRVGRAPDGIRRFYAPLALISWPRGVSDDGSTLRVQPFDCRQVFPSLTELTKPGIRVVRLYTLDSLGRRYPLHNDSVVPVNFMEGGIDIECDRAIAPESIPGEDTPQEKRVFSRPKCSFAVDIPLFGANISNVDWPGWMSYQSIILMGDVFSSERIISWRPLVGGVREILRQLPNLAPRSDNARGVLARLTLKGNFIWARDNPAIYLDGSVFGVQTPGSDHTDINLPSGDNKPGSDFEIWFWLNLSFLSLSLWLWT